MIKRIERIVRHFCRCFGLKGGRGKDLDRKFLDRRDLRRYELSDELAIDVFWKILPVGRGPALSLFVLGHEVLKFDCFGPEEGHFHVDFLASKRPPEDRIFLGGTSVEFQIERTLFELERNVIYYLQRHPNKDVRDFEYPVEAVIELMPELRELMLEFKLRVDGEP